MLKEIIISVQAYFKAHRFIKKHNLWKWIIIPGIIYAILFFVGMYFFVHTANNFFEYVNKHFLESSLQKLKESFLGFLITLGTIMVWIMTVLFYFSLFKYFSLIVGSPIFAYLSEKTEAIIEGYDLPFSFKELFNNIIRGIKIALRNALWQTVYSIGILILSLIPLIGWATPILAVIVECYYYGFSMLDYSMYRHKKTSVESIYFISNHKGLAIGNGVVFYLMHIVPIVGWVLAPAYAVVAATLSMYPLKEENNSIA
ncbi:MAG: EI24 domain-containing protein [Bacteroidetes bacterium]|nr:EI24 domain-containing protein [Bacteroidota bacterium]